MPLQNGLYAAAAGAILYALFCTSRQISTGPELVAGGGGRRGGAADRAEGRARRGAGGGDHAGHRRAVPALAVFRMGWIARFLSKPVITGFLAGAAIDVVIGELPKLTGTDADGVNAWRELGSWVRARRRPRRDAPGRARSRSRVILGLRFARARGPRGAGARRRRPARVARCSTSGLTGSRSSATCRAGCPRRRCRAPTLVLADVRDDRGRGLRAAADRVLADRRRCAGLRDAPPLPDRRRPGVGRPGRANVGAGVFQGMPVSTSLSASSLNESAGARTPVASLVTGALVVLTLLVLAPLFSELPKAVLAAVIIDAVVFGMIDVGGVAAAAARRARRLRDRDRRDPRRALGRRAGRRRDRHRAVARVADLGRDPPADPGAGP